MPADPLFVDLRIALGNAQPIGKLLSEHPAAGDAALAPLTLVQRVLLDAGLAQMTQSVYVAAENILLKIATAVDGGAPTKDENWHASLLARMANEFPGRRPAFLSPASADMLTKLRGFRHVARNGYAHQLDHDRLVSNAHIAVMLLPSMAADIDALERYLVSDTGTD